VFQIDKEGVIFSKSR